MPHGRGRPRAHVHLAQPSFAARPNHRPTLPTLRKLHPPLRLAESCPWLGTGTAVCLPGVICPTPLLLCSPGIAGCHFSCAAASVLTPPHRHPGMLCPPCPLQRSHLVSEILSITVMLHNFLLPCEGGGARLTLTNGGHRQMGAARPPLPPPSSALQGERLEPQPGRKHCNLQHPAPTNPCRIQ